MRIWSSLVILFEQNSANWFKLQQQSQLLMSSLRKGNCPALLKGPRMCGYVCVRVCFRVGFGDRGDTTETVRGSCVNVCVVLDVKCTLFLGG